MRIPFFKGAEGKLPPPVQSEMGAAGMSYGVLGRLINQEYLIDLTGANGLRIWERMRRSDPKIYGLLRALSLPLVRAEWEIEPAMPEEGGEPTDRAEEIADFVEECLFEEMDKTWEETLTEIMLHLDFGFACFEKVWYVEDGEVKLRHLGYLPPGTITDIYVKNREVDYIVQQTNEKSTVNIPGRKLVWFVNQKEGDNFQGIPILRPMYKPWHNKERAEVLLLILAERMGGWLKFVAPPGATPQDIAAANIIGKEFRVNEAMYMIIPNGWEATVESATDVTLADLLAYIRQCNEEITAAAVAQVLELGTSESGSRALGRTLGDMFMDFEQARASYIQSVFNDDQGLIAELCAYNFPDWKENLPRLTCGKVDRLDIKNFALALQALAAAGMPFGSETWEWLRKQADMPEEEDLDDKAQEDAIDPKMPSPWQATKSEPPKPPVIGKKQPPGEGDYAPTKDEVDEQPED